MSQKEINLHINKMILHGFNGVRHDELHQAVQKELQRLISSQGHLSNVQESRSAKKVSVRPIKTARNIRARTLGQRIAGSIYKGVLK